MKRAELIKLKKLLQQEINRRNRINKLLSEDLIREFLSLNDLNINELPTEDNWFILKELLKEFTITESNGILVFTGSYLSDCRVCYQETEFYIKKVSFDYPDIEYQTFEDIETRKIHTAYSDKYIQRRINEEKQIKYYPETEITSSEFCHSRYGKYLVSELIEKYIILNPNNSSENNNGFNEVQKDFFTTAIERGQSKAKQLILSKYPQIRK